MVSQVTRDRMFQLRGHPCLPSSCLACLRGGVNGSLRGQTHYSRIPWGFAVRATAASSHCGRRQRRVVERASCCCLLPVSVPGDRRAGELTGVHCCALGATATLATLAVPGGIDDAVRYESRRTHCWSRRRSWSSHPLLVADASSARSASITPPARSGAEQRPAAVPAGRVHTLSPTRT